MGKFISKIKKNLSCFYMNNLNVLVGKFEKMDKVLRRKIFANIKFMFCALISTNELFLTLKQALKILKMV